MEGAVGRGSSTGLAEGEARAAYETHCQTTVSLFACR